MSVDETGHEHLASAIQDFIGGILIQDFFFGAYSQDLLASDNQRSRFINMVIAIHGEHDGVIEDFICVFHFSPLVV